MFFFIFKIFSLFSCICSLFLLGCTYLTESTEKTPSLQIYFIDVGQGDACLIQTPSHHFYLFDTGNQDAILLNFLKKKQVDTLSAIFISHPDFDHYGALVSILKEIPVKKVYLPLEKCDHPLWIESIEALDAALIEKVTLKAGDTLIWDGVVHIQTLWPYSKVQLTGNNLSTVLRLEFAQQSVLLTGDIENLAELEILETRNSLKSDILHVAHHGSRTSSGLPFLQAVQPNFAIISCDSTVYGHPHAEALADLKFILKDSTRILRTDRIGTIGFELSSRGVIKI